MMTEPDFTERPSTQASFTEPTYTEIPPSQAPPTLDHALWMDLFAQISSLGTRMEDLTVVSDTQFYSMENKIDQYQTVFASRFEYLQHRIDRIEDCMECLHNEMMAYLHSLFLPPPFQSWWLVGNPFCSFFMLSKGEIFLESRRLDIGDSYMNIIFCLDRILLIFSYFSLLDIWCTDWYIWHMMYDMPINLMTYIGCSLL